MRYVVFLKYCLIKGVSTKLLRRSVKSTLSKKIYTEINKSCDLI